MLILKVVGRTILKLAVLLVSFSCIQNESKKEDVDTMELQVTTTQNSLSPLQVLSERSDTSNSSSIEEYFERKSQYEEFLNNESTNPEWNFEADSIALNELEIRIRKILAGHPLQNAFSNSKMHLNTLYHELGYGAIDGLYIEKDSIYIVCTKKEIVRQHFEDEESINFDDLNTSQLGSIFYTMVSNASVIGVCSFNESMSLTDRAYTCLAVTSQDPEPFQTNSLYAFWQIGDYIYLARQWYTGSDFEHCPELWDSIRNSNSRNASHIKETQQYASYCKCISENLSNQLKLEVGRKRFVLTIENILKEM